MMDNMILMFDFVNLYENLDVALAEILISGNNSISIQLKNS